MAPATGITGRRAALICCVAFLLFLSGIAFHLVLVRTVPKKQVPPRLLPLDVDSRVTDFRFFHEFSGGSLRITGKQLVRRGQKFFAVRSMLVKTNIFKDISGVYRDKKNRVEFAAGGLEWELALDKPLLLRDVERISVNNAATGHARCAEIDLRTRLVTVHGDRTRSYALK